MVFGGPSETMSTNMTDVNMWRRRRVGLVRNFPPSWSSSHAQFFDLIYFKAIKARRSITVVSEPLLTAANALKLFR